MPADRCALLLGPARTACEQVRGLASTAAGVTSFVGDPAGSIARAAAQAASWVLAKVAEAVNATTQVDFTNPGFLREYALVFGASTFLTVILWLLAIVKRAVRGVPVGQAVGEAVGLLWLAVLASAFTPLALALLVGLTDTVSTGLVAATGTDTRTFLTGLAHGLTPVSPAAGGGPVMLLLVALFTIAAGVVIWVELLLRAAMLYVGAVLGCVVYTGLVDRSLWRHVRRWAGLMLAVDLAKPVLVVVLGLAAAVTSTGSPADAFSSVLSGLALLFLAIFASVAVYRFVPTFGDDMAQLHATRHAAQNAGPAAAVVGPAGYVRAGIATHAGRAVAAAAPAQTAAGVGRVPVAAGLAADAGRRTTASTIPYQPPAGADRPPPNTGERR